VAREFDDAILRGQRTKTEPPVLLVKWYDLSRWLDCDKCRDEIETEMYVYYGTNEYNFEVLENPPEYEPATCDQCGRVIVLADGGYSSSADGYRCGPCTAAEHPELFR